MAGPSVLRFLALGFGLAALAGCATPSSITASQSAIPASTQALTGATAQVLNADFGAPLLLRTDGQAQVWVYQSSICGLQVFLYPDSSGTPRVAAAIPDNGDASACMKSFAHTLTDAALERPAAS
jgi:hypothetical protein